MNKTFLTIAALGTAVATYPRNASCMLVDGCTSCIPKDSCADLVGENIDTYGNRIVAFFDEFAPISCPPKNNMQPKQAATTTPPKAPPVPARPKITRAQKPAPLPMPSQVALPQAPKARIKIEQLHKHQAVMSRKEGENLIRQFGDFHSTHAELLSFVHTPEFESHVTALLKAISKNEIIISLKGSQQVRLTLNEKIEISPVESSAAKLSGYSMVILIIDERPYSYLVNWDDISG